METTYYQSIIQEELTRRIDKNPRYSLRAFADALKVDVGSLSKVLSGKMIPSWKMSKNILAAIALTPSEQEKFFDSVARLHKDRNFKRLTPEIRNFRPTKKNNTRELTTEIFRVISDWYHYGILELTFTDDFQSDPKWIARQLGTTYVEAKMAISRLLELGLLEKKKGSLVKSVQHITTGDRQITTSAHKRRQKQILEKAIESLEEDPIEVRDITAMCMAIDPAKIPEAKKRIQKFKNELCDFLESGERKQVYEISISLFPTQKKKE